MNRIFSLLLASGVSLVALTGMVSAQSTTTVVRTTTTTTTSPGIPAAIVEIDNFQAAHPPLTSESSDTVKRTREQALDAYQRGDDAAATKLVIFARRELGMPEL
ncbi:MAG: hypothetical protein P4M15_06420 [Alphaproteobacteria bacterium]|nr:hypothetical protein [Alphaproteobacteria bacterium]